MAGKVLYTDSTTPLLFLYKILTLSIIEQLLWKLVYISGSRAVVAYRLFFFKTTSLYVIGVIKGSIARVN